MTGVQTCALPIYGISLDAGMMSVFDTDGSAIVVHAMADDYKTQPTGNAGDRFACGIIEKGK